jgi:hypothetical protein
MERDTYRTKDVGGMYLNPFLVKIINDCEATCEHMIHHLLMGRDLSLREDQISLLYDCANICNLTARYIARGSFFAKSSAALCEEVCAACGNECERFSDQMSQHCAIVCFNCAKHCGDFARS